MFKILTMDVFEILAKLEQKEASIGEKLHKLTTANLNPFPMERIKKGKLLLKLIYEFKKHVEADEFILAGMKLRDLEMEGLRVLPESK
ncbi:hypothetical protein [Aquiflexum lacus]|uniref:hypothetical protein n=1 Tax=Aquiflexum lacus TaxID=2483805 RepID=UPI001E4E1024|nr:hypothetical protein [Aquiflexum lacus]